MNIPVPLLVMFVTFVELQHPSLFLRIFTCNVGLFFLQLQTFPPTPFFFSIFGEAGPWANLYKNLLTKGLMDTRPDGCKAELTQGRTEARPD